MRTTLIRGTAALTVVLLMSVAPAFAQSLVKGKVVDASDKPVEGAIVTFESQNSNQKRDTKTDKKGEFLQVGLNSGPWKITVVQGRRRHLDADRQRQPGPSDRADVQARGRWTRRRRWRGGGDPKAAAELQNARDRGERRAGSGQLGRGDRQVQ